MRGECLYRPVMLFPRWIPILLSVATLGACSSSPECPECSSGSTGAGEQDAGNGNPVSGVVFTMNSTTFDSVVAYTKPATVSADGPSGNVVVGEYDGTSFTLDGVAGGGPWFFVQPKDASDTVYPTFTHQVVPTTKAAPKVIDRQVLASIGVAAGLVPSPLHAQIILRVTDGTSPLSGVSAAAQGADAVLYDLGPEGYSAKSKGTSDRGMIILMNESDSTITLVDAVGHSYSVNVRAVAGTATFIPLVLD
jgi:hypothetical protein